MDKKQLSFTSIIIVALLGVLFVSGCIILFVTKKCPECGGSGTVTRTEYCSNCWGTGKVKEYITCDECGGNGEKKCNYENRWKWERNWLDILAGTNKDWYDIVCRGGRVEGKTTYDEQGVFGCSRCSPPSRICPICNGRGFLTCPKCHGSGKVERETQCSRCGGTGSVSFYVSCQKCQRKGKLNIFGGPAFFH